MFDDPTINRIRTIRHQISERYHHDTAQIISHYAELEQRYHDRIIMRVVSTNDEIPRTETIGVSDTMKESPQALVGNF